MTEKEKTASPILSVGADQGQPNFENTLQSITNNNMKINSTKSMDEAAKKVYQKDDSAYLPIISMNELYENVYHSRPPIIDGLLYAGTYLFVGAPKVGKSFFMAQLAYHISTGISLWDFPVRKGSVLYLALEDDYGRLQERMYRMFGTDCSESLFFSICAKQLGAGLDEQLQKFMQEHPDTKLIIIDTLQKIRETGGDKFSYANDYEVVGKLKQFADQNQVCLLLVHHTRKQQADDKFDMISGTNGLLGAADDAFLLQKEKRTENKATLDISGRDQQDQRLYISRDTEKLIWQLVKAETELWKEPPDPIIEVIAKVITSKQPTWNGSPTELVNMLGLEIKPNVLSLRLNINAGKLLDEYHIHYENSRNHNGRNIKLALETLEA